MKDDPRETVRDLAALARIPLSEDRIAALAPSLTFVQTQVALLADIDYGGAEPAGPFPPCTRAQR
jgi:Asp-tRNA(Asn)/Glu-tRNA(Gln) amidotransferase C subunit